MKKKDELAKPNSCFNKAKDDAPETIRDWCRRRVFRGKNKADDPKIVEAMQLAEDMEDMKKFKDVDKARTAIVEKIGPYKKGSTPTVNGKIDCPICGKKESLQFSRAGYNGHIHASCPGCVSWME